MAVTTTDDFPRTRSIEADKRKGYRWFMIRQLFNVIKHRLAYCSLETWRVSQSWISPRRRARASLPSCVSSHWCSIKVRSCSSASRHWRIWLPVTDSESNNTTYKSKSQEREHRCRFRRLSNYIDMSYLSINMLFICLAGWVSELASSKRMSVRAIIIEWRWVYIYARFLEHSRE